MVKSETIDSLLQILLYKDLETKQYVIICFQKI